MATKNLIKKYKNQEPLTEDETKSLETAIYEKLNDIYGKRCGVKSDFRIICDEFTCRIRRDLEEAGCCTAPDFLLSYIRPATKYGKTFIADCSITLTFEQLLYLNITKLHGCDKNRFNQFLDIIAGESVMLITEMPDITITVPDKTMSDYSVGLLSGMSPDDIFSGDFPNFLLERRTQAINVLGPSLMKRLSAHIEGCGDITFPEDYTKLEYTECCEIFVDRYLTLCNPLALGTVNKLYALLEEYNEMSEKKRVDSKFLCFRNLVQDYEEL